MQTTIGNVCFILNKDKSKVLLLQRNRHPMQGKMTGVGGKTGFGEDIRQSCLREVKEETGLDLIDLRLTGVLKTILIGNEPSSWILFVYTGTTDTMECKPCEEGTLQWVNIKDLDQCNLIGFIREILPLALQKNQFFEGTIYHDIQGDVIEITELTGSVFNFGNLS